MLTRFFIRTAGLALALFWGASVLLLVLLHLRPFTDPDLQAATTPPDGCAVPCFVGIRPGTTTTTQAIDILAKHAWIGDVYYSFSGQDFAFGWNGTQPAIFSDQSTVWVGVQGDFVRSLAVSTQATLASFWLTYGQPDWVVGQSLGRKGYFYIAGYENRELVATFELHPTDTLWQVMQTPVTLEWMAKLPDNPKYPAPNLIQLRNGRATAAQSQ